MTKKVIMLACSAGMSTSMLVANMQKAATSDNIDVDIFATASSGIDDAMEEKNPDVLMLGPQVRFMEKDLKGRLDIPVEVIDIRDYGTMNGEKVLQTALGLIDQG
ncbi:PTS sugar transporter subunit IIB [uncultured Lacticaseibacillus sp.]|uniref:PTS sugar transporter subunit IIB n=1 Tax=uncultured Lacticaseibacillus sp. TaxID=2775882 RepID=UPI00259A31B4|nr:PTS sugar transporter subunit IIB [uncultured Lacticaseibacillus sp.]